MTKHLKRTMVTLLATSMLVNPLGSTAIAAETTGTGTKANPYVTMTETTSTDTTTGNTTVETETLSRWEETTTTDKDDTKETTTVKGSENVETATVTDTKGNTLLETETVKGEETVNQETTLADTKVSEKVELSSTETTTPGSEVSEAPKTTENKGEWTVEGTESGEWTLETTTEGTYETTDATKETKTETADLSSLSNPLDKGSVTVKLQQGTVTETRVVVSLEEAAKAGISIPDELTGGSSTAPASMREVLENGEKVTTALYASDGTTVIGYEIKTTTETKGEEKADNTDKATVTETKIVETNKTAPTGYTVGTKETSETDEAGNPVKKTVITEEVTDDDGKVIGYKVTTTTKTTETIEKTEAGADVPTKEETDTVFTLPIKPAESETIDVATQVTTKVTVEEVKNYFGEVIGYKTTTVKTNQEGKELSKETETVYGTTTLIQKTTETKNVTSESTQTKETTVTETKTILGETVTKETTSTDERSFSTETTKVEDSESWKLIETEDGIYFSYKGEMYPVVALENNGKVSTVSLQPDMAGLNPKEGTHNISTMLGNTLTMRNYVPQEGDYNFLYTNDGLESSVQVSYYNSEKKLYGIAMVTQFELTDKDGNKHYVLCADMDTAAHGGQGYSMQNVESADYYQHEGATEHIKAIAYNGYWGTESGIGSLENVKELLRKERAAGKNKLTDTEINSLTDGIALSMTQAALWRYGNASDTKAVDADVLSYGYDIDPYTYQDGGYTYRVDKWAFSDAQKEVMRVLYNTLINLDSTSYTDNTTTLITDKNFANEAVIEIKDKTENNKYNTDISFTLQMQPSMLNDDDLIIKVIDENNQVIATKRISGDDTATGYGMAKKEVTENGMVYTLEDLEISEGVKITLNLSGTQNLNKGVYLYSAKVYTDSQTFVGVSEGTREVDLSVGISFTTEAAKGAIAHTTASTTQTKTDTKTETKTDVTTESQTVTKETTEKTVADVTNTATKVYADVTVTSVETTSNTTDKTWESTTEKTYEVPSPTPTTPSYPTPSPSTTPTPSVTPSTTPSTTPESTPETVVEVPDEDVPLGEMVEFEDPEDAEEVILDGEVPLAQLPDSEVPLSDVPVTGDTVMVWSVLFIFSCSIVLAMGLCAVVTQCDRKKKHTHNHK